MKMPMQLKLAPFYDGNKLIAELAPTYRLDFLYDENNLLYGFTKDSKDTYYYVKDYLQSILGIVDSNGQLVVKYSQTAYGNVTITQDTDGIGAINPFHYKGYYYDKESGMYYCQSRYYVPEWGRWLNADSSEYLDTDDIGKINLFAYCGCNPVMYYDPNGHSIIAIILILAAGAIIGTLAGGHIAAHKENATVGEIIITVLMGTLIGIAAAGLIVAGVAGVGAFLCASTVFGGVNIVMAGSIGLLAYNSAALLLNGLYQFNLEIVDTRPNNPYKESPLQPTPPHPSER